MSELIENYTAKNFGLEITGALYAWNHGLDFAGLLDTEQALGAKILTETIRKLDEMNPEDWEIYGWYGDQRFGDDFNGEMEDGTSFFNEAYFTNSLKMDDLWRNMPCLKLEIGETFSSDDKHVFVSMIMAPYERTTIMEPALIHEMIIRNEEGFPFPGSGATMKVVNRNYIRKKTKHEKTYDMDFRVPETYYIRYKKDGTWMNSWWIITPKDFDEMSETLREMRSKERDE